MLRQSKSISRGICIYMCAQVRDCGQHCICATLRKATRSVSQLYDNALRPSGLRATQFHILAELHGVGEATVSQLTKILIIEMKDSEDY